MAKRKKPALPRLTVFAMSNRELVAFAQAVETLRLLVEDLRILTAAAKGRKSRPKKPAADQAAGDQAAAELRPVTPSIPGMEVA